MFWRDLEGFSSRWRQLIFFSRGSVTSPVCFSVGNAPDPTLRPASSQHCSSYQAELHTLQLRNTARTNPIWETIFFVYSFVTYLCETIDSDSDFSRRLPTAPKMSYIKVWKEIYFFFFSNFFIWRKEKYYFSLLVLVLLLLGFGKVIVNVYKAARL